MPRGFVPLHTLGRVVSKGIKFHLWGFPYCDTCANLLGRQQLQCGNGGHLHVYREQIPRAPVATFVVIRTPEGPLMLSEDVETSTHVALHPKSVLRK